MNGGLRMWTIFRHPLDAPGMYVTREFLIWGEEPIPFRGRPAFTLRGARRHVPQWATLLARDPGDHPSVVESWI